MSLRVGLGASQADLDVQGEIDFDFFEESEGDNKSKSCSSSKTVITSSPVDPKEICSELCSRDSENGSHPIEYDNAECKNDQLKFPESPSNYNKPLITVSCDDATGAVKKTTIEAVIPTPFTYKENKCGNVLTKNKVLNSPRLKNKAFKDDSEISDDSSISSMSESDSISEESEDSFELDGSDSMTDVSPLASPYPYAPKSGEQVEKSEETLEEGKELKKDGVKFNEKVAKKQCEKCESIDFRELVNAMNRLKMKQHSRPLSTSSSKDGSSVITHNARCRKNLSFSNEEVRKIDSDNQVLLKKIIAQQNRTKAANPSAVHVRPSSAVNRQKRQRQIELENLALLKRLESTKASKNLSRSQLLHDFDNRSSGLLSRASSSFSSSRTSLRTSGRSSAISIKSSSMSFHSPNSHSSSTVDQK